MKKKLIKILMLSALLLTNINNIQLNAQSFTLTKQAYKTKSGLELEQLLKEKKVTSKELVSLAYEIIEEENPKLNAVITTRKKEALQEAETFDANPQFTTPFAGVPILLKGLGHVYKGADRSNGSLLYKGDIAKNDSSVAKDYKALGFIILGQTNYPEYGFRNITDSKLFGNTSNPWDIERNAGGSSGGSAAAIASGMVPIASGSDAGGSIRIPSSWTGLIGLKPSRAMTDNGKKTGVNTSVHFPLTKSITDAEVLLEYLSKKKTELIIVDDIKTLKIGYTTKSPMGTEVSEDAKQAVLESVAFLKKQGFTVEQVDLPINGRQLMRDYTYGNLGYPLGTMTSKQIENLFTKQAITKFDLDPLTWALGTTKAKDVSVKMDFAQDLKQYTATMEQFHETYPIMLTPTNAQAAPLNTDPYVLEEDKAQLYNIADVKKEERFELLVKQWEPMLQKTPFTQMANLTGEPALSLPTYLNKQGLPLGVMLNGKWGMDRVLLQFGKLFEQNHQFKMRKEIVAVSDDIKNTEEKVVVEKQVVTPTKVATKQPQVTLKTKVPTNSTTISLSVFIVLIGLYNIYRKLNKK